MLRGKKQPLAKAPEVKAEMPCSIHNRFDLEVIDTKTGEVKQRAYAENIILAALWTRMFAPNNYFSNIHYGTGTGTLSATRTSLFSFLGYGTPIASEDVARYDYDLRFASLTRKIQLSETTAVGSTLTEVGIGYSSASASLCTHALLKDMNGNTISIAKTDTDVINIYATVFVHWDSQYDNGGIEFFPRLPGSRGTTDSNAYSFLGWLWGLGVWSTTYLSVWFNPGVNPNFKSYGDPAEIAKYRKAVTATYNASAKTMTITAARAAVADLNQAGGWGSIQVGYSYAGVASSTNHVFANGDILCYVGGSWYPGTAMTGEALGTGNGSTKEFRTAFPLISNATVRVNGVAVSTGVTVDENKPGNLANFGHNFRIIKTEVLPYAGVNPWGISITPGAGVCDYDSIYQAFHGSPIRMTYYNPYYALGITSMKILSSTTTVDASNGNAAWTTLFLGMTGVQAIPAAYQNCKYWRVSHTEAGDQKCVTCITTSVTADNIHFATAPAVGDVITIDYTTKTIAKDLNHVFDFSMVITLGEKTV